MSCKLSPQINNTRPLLISINSAHKASRQIYFRETVNKGSVLMEKNETLRRNKNARPVLGAVNRLI
jgi:hypothetical protein